MIPALLFSGYSGTGKSTFLSSLIPYFTERDVKVGYIKHHHGKYYTGPKIKDTGKMILAGASKSLLIAQDVAIMEKPISSPELNHLETFIEKYFQDCNLVFIEGFKDNKEYPKVILLRERSSEVTEWFKKVQADKNIIAIVTDEEIKTPTPCFKFSEHERFCQFITNKLLPVTSKK